MIGFCTFLLLVMLSWGLHRIRVTAPDVGDYARAHETHEPQRPSVLASPPTA